MNLGIENKVKFFNDFISDADVHLFFSACDAVITPYKEATQSGIVQIAHHFDKPVISSNKGGLSECIIDNTTGLLINKCNPINLAQAINKYYSLNLEQNFIKGIKEEKDKYSWRTFTSELINFVK